jgi:uncharacterized membrane protein YeaQ/YmgE (transglycosylase-associated protein family)
MPPNFKFPISEELWVPLYNEFPLKLRDDPLAGSSAPAVMGRLKQGVSLDQANAEFVGLAKRIAKDNPKTNGQLTSAHVQPLLNFFTGPQLRQIVYAMLGAVILVLLIACVNVMNMQFGRAALRAKELAIRGALGATRWRLVRQMLTESFLVAFMGAIVGVVLQDLTTFLQRCFELLNEFLARVPRGRAEFRAAGGIDVELVHVDHHVEPRRNVGDDGGERAQRHGLIVRLPVVLAFGNAFQSFANADCFPVEFSEQKFSDFHRVLSPWTKV